MSRLTIHEIALRNDGFTVEWALDDPPERLDVAPLVVQYDAPVSTDETLALNCLLSVLAPVLSEQGRRVTVAGDFKPDPAATAYWRRLLAALGLDGDALGWDGAVEPNERDAVPVGSGVALMFGGGVESLFGYHELRPLDPTLIALVGDGLMNNDARHRSIKRELEDRFVADTGATLRRVATNAWGLVREPDDYKNRYVTGPMFYWHSAPICRAEGVGTLYECMELETVRVGESRDLSISPGFLRHVAADGGPRFLPIFTCYAKIEMLDALSKTPLLEYLYSCYRNSERRWCGRCPKCFRVSEYCEWLNIDKARIGMKEGIVGRADRKRMARSRWELPEKLYGSRRGALRHKRARFYARKVKRALTDLDYLRRKVKNGFR